MCPFSLLFYVIAAVLGSNFLGGNLDLATLIQNLLGQ